VLTDPHLINTISIKDFDYFTSHNLLDKLDSVFAKSLVATHGQKWRDMRLTLTPIFTSSKMKTMFGLLSSHIENFMKHFAKKAGNDGENEIDALEIFSRFTADGIATAALGFEGDCVERDDSEFFKLAKKIVNAFFGPLGNLKFLFVFFMPKFYQFLQIQLLDKEMIQFFRRVVIDAMNTRDRNNIKRPDLIQLMLEVRKGELTKSNVKNLQEIAGDDEYWIAQGIMMFFGGFETISNFLQTATFELAKNPDIQQELYREICEVRDSLNGKPVTYEALHKMKFMDMFVSENLRMYPPVPQNDRKCTKRYEMNLENGKSVVIEKNSMIFLPIYVLHHDAAYFPNPEKFDPYRFSDENKDSIVAGSYLPFGLGPRSCSGK